MRPDLEAQLRDVWRSIDGVLLAGPTLHHALKRGHVPFGAVEHGRWVPTPLAEGVARYGNSLVFAIWQMLRAVEAQRFAFTGAAGIAPALAPEEPDEAPGLAPASPEPADEGADRQQRLAVTADQDRMDLPSSGGDHASVG